MRHRCNLLDGIFPKPPFHFIFAVRAPHVLDETASEFIRGRCGVSYLARSTLYVCVCVCVLHIKPFFLPVDLRRMMCSLIMYYVVVVRRVSSTAGLSMPGKDDDLDIYADDIHATTGAAYVCISIPVVSTPRKVPGILQNSSCFRRFFCDHADSIFRHFGHENNNNDNNNNNNKGLNITWQKGVHSQGTSTHHQQFRFYGREIRVYMLTLEPQSHFGDKPVKL